MDPSQKAALSAVLSGKPTKKSPAKRSRKSKKAANVSREGKAAKPAKEKEDKEKADRAVWREDEEDHLLESWSRFIKAGGGNIMGTIASKLAPLTLELREKFYDLHPTEYTLKTEKQVRQKLENWKKKYKAVKAECANLRREKTRTGRETKWLEVDDLRANDMWRLWDSFHAAFGDDPTLNPELATETGLGDTNDDDQDQNRGGSDDDNEKEGEDPDEAQEETGPREPAGWSPPKPPELDENVEEAHEGPHQAGIESTGQEARPTPPPPPGRVSQEAVSTGRAENPKRKGTEVRDLAKKAKADGKDGESGPRISGSGREGRAMAAMADFLAESRESNERQRENELRMELRDRAENREFQRAMFRANLDHQNQLAMFQARQSRESMLLIGALMQGNMPGFPNVAQGAPSQPAFPGTGLGGFGTSAGFPEPPPNQAPMDGTPESAVNEQNASPTTSGD